ncbi:MAG: hypothetical protein COB90_00235 [Hyphomicrobiales bacterium]|nr:MAG: hypothetical protein COB90_00235 [Hyphomicrobiales bacterium]
MLKLKLNPPACADVVAPKVATPMITAAARLIVLDVMVIVSLRIWLPVSQAMFVFVWYRLVCRVLENNMTCWR